MSLPKFRRVVRSSEFRAIYQSGARLSSRYFVAFCVPADKADEPTRFGFTIPRAVGSAVVRNRIRRRMREACRASLSFLPAGWKLVFNPRRNVLQAPFEALCREVAKTFEQCAHSSSSS